MIEQGPALPQRISVHAEHIRSLDVAWQPSLERPTKYKWRLRKTGGIPSGRGGGYSLTSLDVA